MVTEIHPFEKAGLGKAPFRFVGMYEDRGPKVISEANGVTMTSGAPGQPMGTCAYCSTGIAYCCQIRSADGKEFVVGTDCVAKTDAALEQVVDRELAKAKKAADLKRVANARAAVDSNEQLRAALSAMPHRHAGLAASGKSKLDEVLWLLRYGGAAGRKKAAVAIERALKPGAARDPVGQSCDPVAAARGEERAHGKGD